jgi:hypothetical protein
VIEVMASNSQIGLTHGGQKKQNLYHRMDRHIQAIFFAVIDKHFDVKNAQAGEKSRDSPRIFYGSRANHGLFSIRRMSFTPFDTFIAKLLRSE